MGMRLSSSLGEIEDSMTELRFLSTPHSPPYPTPGPGKGSSTNNNNGSGGSNGGGARGRSNGRGSGAKVPLDSGGGERGLRSYHSNRNRDRDTGAGAGAGAGAGHYQGRASLPNSRASSLSSRDALSTSAASSPALSGRSEVLESPSRGFPSPHNRMVGDTPTPPGIRSPSHHDYTPILTPMNRLRDQPLSVQLPYEPGTPATAPVTAPPAAGEEKGQGLRAGYGSSSLIASGDSTTLGLEVDHDQADSGRAAFHFSTGDDEEEEEQGGEEMEEGEVPEKKGTFSFRRSPEG